MVIIMFNEFFKNHRLTDEKTLSFARRKKIENKVLSRIKEEPTERKRISIKRFAAVAAVAAVAVSLAAVGIGALGSVTSVINGIKVEPEYVQYIDTDGAMVEIISYPVPEEALTEEAEGHTPVGELRLKRLGELEGWNGRARLVDEEGTEFFTGVNNVLVITVVTHHDGSKESVSYDVTNMRDDWGYDALSTEDYYYSEILFRQEDASHAVWVPQIN